MSKTASTIGRGGVGALSGGKSCCNSRNNGGKRREERVGASGWRSAAFVVRASSSYSASSSKNKNKKSNKGKTANSNALASVTGPKDIEKRQKTKKGCDVLVDALVKEGVDVVFAYPGGASMEIHQALTRQEGKIQNILCRHEQGEVFAAEGYAKVTGKVGVCIATSGPGATNLVTGIADAMLDSVPLVAITGQVPRRMIGTDAFQETPTIEITRPITKHNYLVMDVKDIPRIVSEAFYLANSGRPGPVLIDIPKDVQQQMLPVSEIDDTPFDPAECLEYYYKRLPEPPSKGILLEIVRAIANAKRPVLYVGGGCVDASEELAKFVELTGIPVCQTLMGLGSFSETHPLALQMLGMHGTIYANYAIDKADLLLAFGVRFDDRVTGKLKDFAPRASVVHVDIDAAEIGKNKAVDFSVCADMKEALRGFNQLLEENQVVMDAQTIKAWQDEVAEVKRQKEMRYPEYEDAIAPQHAIRLLEEVTEGNAVVSTGVGQHQMWAAQWYRFSKPRRWLTSGGLGSMGYGLPAAIGAAAAFKAAGEKVTVVDIDGDGSFIMNVQELACIKAEDLDVKVMVINNQHLGMVVQWEDRFYKANRAHTYLGLEDKEWHKSADELDIYPDFVKMSESFGIPAKRVIHKKDLRGAIEEMIAHDGPYLLDVMVPHIEHVLPMIPGGGGFNDTISEGDGSMFHEERPMKGL
jgi:acetolactate synthase-1/2/3 large subunit